VRSGRGESGFSLIEVTVATSILVVLVGLVTSSVNQAGKVGQMTAYRAALRSQARSALERIARLVRDSGPSHLTANSGNITAGSSLGSSSITFYRATGWSGGALTWSGAYTVAWVSAPGEIDNDGLDNDGNGLIDDGIIQVTEPDASNVAHTYTLATGCPKLALGEGQDVGLSANGVDDNGNGLVDEAGLSFVYDSTYANVLTIRISLAHRAPDTTDIVEESVATSVLLQNP
jgi:prepilin-type N-terminal cleavage/methylation domain-containing protein